MDEWKAYWPLNTVQTHSGRQLISDVMVTVGVYCPILIKVVLKLHFLKFPLHFENLFFFAFADVLRDGTFMIES